MACSKSMSSHYFNPLPRKEGDFLWYRPLCHPFLYFNPLPRKEGDASTLTAEFPDVISIHSLVKRETFMMCEKCRAYFHFNPLPRKEGDAAILAAGKKCCDEHFNPLPRKEGDWKAMWLQVVKIISIHSLVKRETQSPRAG